MAQETLLLLPITIKTENLLSAVWKRGLVSQTLLTTESKSDDIFAAFFGCAILSMLVTAARITDLS